MLTCTGASLVDLPGELLRAILSVVDAETLALSVPLVCTAFRAASMEAAVWQAHLPPRAQAQLEALQALGPRPLPPGHLYLALYGRNLLRNPEFRRECNTPTLWGSAGVERTAWVVNQSVGKEVSWERAPQGMTPPPSPRAAPPPTQSAQLQQQHQQRLRQRQLAHPHHQPQMPPPPPLPYPSCRHAAATGGGDERAAGSAGSLAALMRRALQGLRELASEGVAAVEEGLLLRDQQKPEREAAESDATWAGSEQERHVRHVAGASAPATAAMPAPSPVERPCLAMLGSWSEVVQVVDLQWELQRRGLSAAQAAHLLDAGLGLRLAVHVGSRWDSAGECAMALRLDEGQAAGVSGGGDVVPSLQAYVARPTRTLVYLEREHMRRGVWEEVEHVVTACPRGFRRAVVMLRGRRAPVPVVPPPTAVLDGDEAGTGSAVGVGAGPDDADEDVDVEPTTRFCGAKFASAQLVFC
ncbi:hypothetical protein HXX76_000315 [Chlamydomonas incerta]|uniref:F-box domain-containing protein n=1 Tax=Chlamydomonas incerta TaxID=51695 RepID=A0A835WE35_CHLIN|nr:hypothetical protein HXX76_000315 [Chlamydomonas incerta]|eukprot:KAG2445708.1 hypothetical protein HXX76_000315 [Chlamydomonas incerta]